MSFRNTPFDRAARARKGGYIHPALADIRDGSLEERIECALTVLPELGSLVIRSRQVVFAFSRLEWGARRGYEPNATINDALAGWWGGRALAYVRALGGALAYMGDIDDLSDFEDMGGA